MNRRDFIQYTSTATVSLGIDQLPKFRSSTKPNLIILATNWGFKGTTTDFCKQAKKDGYDGIEMWLPQTKEGIDELIKITSELGLKIGLLFGDGSSDPKVNKANHMKKLNDLINIKGIRPIYINNHAGKDYFDFNTNKDIINETIKFGKDTGIPIYHETHRGRILYSASVAKKFIDEIPDLKLTLDISHWCNVSESLLQDQPDNINAALSRTEHIHSRVGHQEGPQVTDPRAPEWAEAVKAHFEWWDKIVLRKTQKNEPITILTEFGPPNYLPTVPFTKVPLADQWDINVYMMNTLRNRYK
jgi:sugar phosphate isomerase/epimerase